MIEAIFMFSFLVSLLVLVVGYLIYGRLTEKVFSPDDRETPASAINDGVDCVPLPRWKSFMIQLLNIAGTGPIFGALMGAVFGPVVFLWIVLGSILGGAVHDYFSGMISERHEGKSVADLSGTYLGTPVKYIMRVFSILLLLLCGTVFITSPASLIARLTPDYMTEKFWLCVIIIYYIFATLLPIDKIIGRLYPVFGAILIIMAALIAGTLFFLPDYTIPEITLRNLHPDGLPAFPFMFVTVACGAISGFHATQSPVIAKCITSEKQGRSVFYGAMICESVIALVWAAAGVAFYGTSEMLRDAIDTLGQSGVVYDISTKLLGTVGGVLAVVGVVVCPITSGDTAFRSARLIIAEWVGSEQKSFKNRLFITLPLLFCGAVLSQLDFSVLWRYFSWSNQTLAMISLWIATSYIIRNAKKPFYSLITALPASFMTDISVTYILMADEGLSLRGNIAYPVGAAVALSLLAVYLFFAVRASNQKINSR